MYASVHINALPPKQLGPAMSGVIVSINAAELADTFEHMRSWLDHDDCTPANFDVRTNEPDTVLIHVEFDRDDLAEAFQRDFGGSR
jgi:hypothetical protein